MTDRPYSPSWVDRMMLGIDAAPVPNPAIYGGAYLLSVLAFHLAGWADDAAPWGEPQAEWFYVAVFVIVLPVIMHSLDKVAARASRDLAPVLPVGQADSIEYRLTTMPSRTVWAITVPTAILLAIAFGTDTGFVYPGMSGVSRFVFVAAVVWGYTFAPIAIFYVGRQLATIRRSFAAVENIGLFRQQPLYAFSRLPFWTGISFLLLANLSFADFVVRDLERSELVFTLVATAPLVVFAVVAFVIPLQGIHARLESEKERLLEENGSHIEAAHRRMYEAVETFDDAAVSSADKAISSLYRIREEIAKVHTWPWAPGTVRSFLTAIFIPMIVWALQLWASNVL